jgi:hypothetical protein
MFAGAAAPAAQLDVASVMAMCARFTWFGVVSMNGNRAPGANPARSELSEISWVVGFSLSGTAVAGNSSMTAAIAKADTRILVAFISGPPLLFALDEVKDLELAACEMLKRHAASARESQTAKPFLPRMNADGADRKTRRQEAGRRRQEAGTAGPSGKAGPSLHHPSNSKPELLGTRLRSG